MSDAAFQKSGYYLYVLMCTNIQVYIYIYIYVYACVFVFVFVPGVRNTGVCNPRNVFGDPNASGACYPYAVAYA